MRVKTAEELQTNSEELSAGEDYIPDAGRMTTLFLRRKTEGMSWYIFLMKVHTTLTSPASSWPRAKRYRHRRLWPYSLVCLFLALGSESSDSTSLQKRLRTNTASSRAVLRGLVQDLLERIRNFLVAFTASIFYIFLYTQCIFAGALRYL